MAKLFGKTSVHTAMYFGCLMRSWYSCAMPVLQSMIEEARGVIGKLGSVVVRLLMIAGRHCCRLYHGCGGNLFVLVIEVAVMMDWVFGWYGGVQDCWR